MNKVSFGPSVARESGSVFEVRFPEFLPKIESLFGKCKNMVVRNGQSDRVRKKSGGIRGRCIYI